MGDLESTSTLGMWELDGAKKEDDPGRHLATQKNEQRYIPNNYPGMDYRHVKYLLATAQCEGGKAAEFDLNQSVEFRSCVICIETRCFLRFDVSRQLWCFIIPSDMSVRSVQADRIQHRRAVACDFIRTCVIRSVLQLPVSVAASESHT